MKRRPLVVHLRSDFRDIYGHPITAVCGNVLLRPSPPEDRTVSGGLHPFQRSSQQTDDPQAVTCKRCPASLAVAS